MKKLYEAPGLQVHGDIRAVTQGAVGGDCADAFFGTKNDCGS